MAAPSSPSLWPCLVQFCLPHGAAVRADAQGGPPAFFGFMHTFSDGATLYGAALQFEEQLPASAVPTVWGALNAWRR